MKRTILALAAILALSTCACSEIKRLPRVFQRPSSIRTVQQLKALAPKSQPTKVMNGQLSGSFLARIKPSLEISVNEFAGESAASAAYKQGTGVVLKPTAMTDTNTKSALHLFGATMDQKLVDEVKANSNAPIRIMCAAGQSSNLGFLLGYFKNLPKGKHLYMLTMHMNVKLDRGDYLQITAGQNFVEKNSIQVMGDDYMALLTYDTAAGNSMQVMAKFNMPQNDAIAFLDFGYLQLAQVD